MRLSQALCSHSRHVNAKKRPDLLLHAFPRTQENLMHGKRQHVKVFRPFAPESPSRQATLKHRQPHTHKHKLYSRVMAVLEADERRSGEIADDYRPGPGYRAVPETWRRDFGQRAKTVLVSGPPQIQRDVRDPVWPFKPVERRGGVRLHSEPKDASQAAQIEGQTSQDASEVSSLTQAAEIAETTNTPRELPPLLTETLQQHTDKSWNPFQTHLVAPYLRYKLSQDLTLSSKALRTMDKKGGLDEYLLTTSNAMLGRMGQTLRSELKLAIAMMYARGLARNGKTTEKAFAQGLYVPFLSDSAFGQTQRLPRGVQSAESKINDELVREIQSLEHEHETMLIPSGSEVTSHSQT